MSLTLTEDLIRNRVGLQHDNLEDVKSLALPGTYHEKVVSLGTSLRKFSRLKHLDLSRNNITSLQGLENLKLLEKLNFYYNNVETLSELKRLKHNPNLKELDLRLNPVTRTEPDYRLYLIHMLPSLQKLDDRSVRDRERQGALIHFRSSQAAEMTHHPRVEGPRPQVTNPRAEHVKTMESGRVLDDDDVEILDLIARTGGDLQRPRPLTGSSAKEPAVADYSLVGLKKLEPLSLDGPQIVKPVKKNPPSEMDEVMAAYKQKYPNIPDVMVYDADTGTQRQDQCLEFPDEADAYNKFKSHGFFTPHPAGGEVQDPDRGESFVPTERDSYPAPPSQVRLERTRGPHDTEVDLDNSPGQRRAPGAATDRLEGVHQAEEPINVAKAEKYSDEPVPDRAVSRPEDGATSKPGAPIKFETPQSKLFLFQLLDLVDRYWNGSKSLHKNAKFKGLAYSAMQEFMRAAVDDKALVEIHQLRDEMTHLQRENSRIRRQEDIAKSSLEDSAATEAHMKASLQKAFTDLELLKDNLHSYEVENKRLKQKLGQQESYSSQSASQTMNQSQLDELQKQNVALQQEVDRQQVKLQQFTQLQELSVMLQDSHKSLVQTNDHLLKELEENKHRHQHEVKQLNWSYDQLRQTVDHRPRPDTSQVVRDGDNTASAIMYDNDS